MKIQKLLFACAFLYLAISLNAQYIAPQVLPTQGNTLRSGNMVLTYTIGQALRPLSVSALHNLEITPGFEQIIKPLPPGVLSSLAYCSDTSVIITFSNVQAGKGANKVEWAKNKTFTGATSFVGWGTITDTIASGAADTIWYRSVDTTDNMKSVAVYTIITIHANPSVSASSNSPLCAYDTLLLSSTSSADSFLWSGPNFFSSSVENPALIPAYNTQGWYIITVVNSNGCSASDSINVIVNGSPFVEVSSNSPVCSSDSIRLVAARL